ncbi:Hypothetical protein GbCGDNIH9_8554 [Granulibacter bethesdensis]|uniref:Uncharacterized protein n=1 Tax=Granulibacter bethesdensis TaxID=364410 RepID=A0AAC9K7R1_9PROT|nr:Hypothetical protein GbCGDNIH9_8554 [Granulibacter bethesdensis]APH62241.1 Hypothetical protein GbCGDNIH8_8554 [Granulibacter bethesdensis]
MWPKQGRDEAMRAMIGAMIGTMIWLNKGWGMQADNSLWLRLQPGA